MDLRVSRPERYTLYHGDRYLGTSGLVSGKCQILFRRIWPHLEYLGLDVTFNPGPINVSSFLCIHPKGKINRSKVSAFTKCVSFVYKGDFQRERGTTGYSFKQLGIGP
jgi:hypothetical protein